MSLEPNPKRTLPVSPQLVTTSEVFRQTYLASGNVAVIEGANDAWSDVSFDLLRDKCGTNRVPIRYFPDRIDGSSYTFVELSINEYLDLLDTPEGARYYLGHAFGHDVIPQLIATRPPPSMIASLVADESPTVWIGGASFSRLHYHPHTEATAHVLCGRKRFVLFAPSQTEDLYPERWYKPLFNFSRVDVTLDDVPPEFSRFRDAEAFECVVEAGQTLFIPAFWWHMVYGEEPSIMLTYFWPSTTDLWAYKRQAWPTFVGKQLRNPTTVKLFMAWRARRDLRFLVSGARRVVATLSRRGGG